MLTTLSNLNGSDCCQFSLRDMLSSQMSTTANQECLNIMAAKNYLCKCGRCVAHDTEVILLLETMIRSLISATERSEEEKGHGWENTSQKHQSDSQTVTGKPH